MYKMAVEYIVYIEYIEAGPASPYVYIADVAEDGVFRSPRVPLVIPTKKGHLPYQEIPETVTKNIQN